MGKQRTANAGVSIFAQEHKVEKKKRKASDVSIFDHVNAADLKKQALEPGVAPAAVPRVAPSVVPPVSAAAAASAQMQAAAYVQAVAWAATAMQQQAAANLAGGAAVKLIDHKLRCPDTQASRVYGAGRELGVVYVAFYSFGSISDH